MDEICSRPAGARFAFWAFFISLFLFFTPFEYGPAHSTLPRYLAVAVSVLVLMPLVIIKKMTLRVPSVLVLIVLGTILFHSVAIISVPAQFTLLIFSNMLLAIVLYEASFHWRKEFVSAVSWLLIINAVVISVQSLLFYAFSSGIYDFHKLLFGSDSRFAEDFLNIARFSGMQIEPGTYANYVACLLAILMLSSDFSERLLWMAFCAIISIFLTNSGSSIYFVPVLSALVAYLWRRKIRPYHILFLAVAMVAYLHFSGVLEHMENRFFERDDGSLSHRIEGVHAYLSMSLEDKLIGVGLDKDPCVRCYYQDIGVTFNLLTRGGIIVALSLGVVLFRIFKINGAFLSTILFLIPLNEKMFFYEASIWLFILFAMTGFKNAKSSKPVRAQTGQLQLARL